MFPTDVYSNLDPAFGPKLKQMIRDSNGRLRVTDGRRSYAQQADLYKRKPLLAAPPGHSLHETGKAGDLEGDLVWAHANAARYGLTFPMLNPKAKKYEPWHVQLLGAKGASMSGYPTSAKRFSPARLLGSMPQNVSVPGSANPDETLAILQQILSSRSGGSSEPLYNPDAAQAANLWGMQIPMPSDTQRLTGQQRLLAQQQAQIEGQTPIDAAQADMAGVDAQQQALQALNGLQVPQREFTPYTPGALPTRERIAMPDRVRPTLDPTTALLSGLASVIAPQGAPAFTGGAMRGLIDRANQQYGDKVDRFKYAVDQADQDYTDKRSAYDIGERANLANLRGGEATRFDNANASFEANRGNILAGAPIAGRRASLVAQLGTPTQPGSLSRRADSIRNIANTSSDVQETGGRIASGLQRNQQRLNAEQTDYTRRLDAAKVIAPLIKDRQHTAASEVAKLDQRTFQQELQQRGFEHTDMGQLNQQTFQAEQNRLGREASAGKGTGGSKAQPGEYLRSRMALSEAIKNRDTILRSLRGKTSPQIERDPRYVAARAQAEQAVDEWQAVNGVPLTSRTFPTYKTPINDLRPNTQRSTTSTSGPARLQGKVNGHSFRLEPLR